MNAPSPRCGSPVRPKEQGGIPVIEPPVCGRPRGHRGSCRSEAAVARKYAADAARIAGIRRRVGKRYGRPSLALAGQDRERRSAA